MNKVIVLFGVNGQLGRALYQSLISSFSVFGIARQDCNITSASQIRGVLERYTPALVINATAFTDVDAAETNRVDAEACNFTGVDILSRECGFRNIGLMHFSTDYVFGDELTRPRKESDSCNPLNFYGQTKLWGEQAIRRNQERYVILRISSLYSSEGRCFPRAILKRAKVSGSVVVVNDQFSRPTSVEAITAVVEKIVYEIINYSWVDWGTYHFAEMPRCSWYDFSHHIIEIAAAIDPSFGNVSIEPCSSKDYDLIAVRPADACLDSSKLCSVIELDEVITGWSEHLRAVCAKLLSDLNPDRTKIR